MRSQSLATHSLADIGSQVALENIVDGTHDQTSHRARDQRSLPERWLSTQDIPDNAIIECKNQSESRKNSARSGHAIFAPSRLRNLNES